MGPDDRRQAVFGGFDGLTSALGLIVATALTVGVHALAVAAVALAVGAAVSMGAGEWLSDPDASRRRAVVMGVATLVASALPAVPFFVLSGLAAFVGCALITTALVVVIAEVRPGGRARSYALTAGILVLAAALAVGSGLIAGAV